MFGLLNCCCVDENIIDCGCWNIGGRTNGCCCCCWVGKNIDDCWVEWVGGVINKSKPFDGVLFAVVDTDEGFIGWKRSFDIDVCWNDSNGSNVIDDDDDGGRTDGVIVGQMEGCVLE